MLLKFLTENGLYIITLNLKEILLNQYSPVRRAQLDCWEGRYSTESRRPARSVTTNQCKPNWGFLIPHRFLLALRVRSVLPSNRAARAEHGLYWFSNTAHKHPLSHLTSTTNIEKKKFLHQSVVPMPSTSWYTNIQATFFFYSLV